jgi:hypothetical protein
MRVLFRILELFVGNMYDRFACMDWIYDRIVLVW